MVSHLDLPVIADLEAMFQLAVTELGPLWNPTEMSAHRECLDILERVCPGCTLRWGEPTSDDVSRMPNNIDAILVGEEANPTTLHLLAHICAALDSGPEWLQWVQAPDTLSAAGATGVHSWGLMLPTSTRTPGVNYTSSVAVRYPPLNREVDGQWIVTHSSGGLEGLVGGYQLVIWKKPSKEFMHARGADLSSVIEPLLQDLIDIHSDESSVLVMCARNEDRDQLLTDSICRGHPQIKVQSVASSAGATATSSIVNQPFSGHLNGRPSDPFDQEECYARCTVAATRAQSLTVIISQLDMAGMMGMMQVLAARARPIHQVYHGATTWTLPTLNGMTHQEQSDAEVASWDISRVSSWSEQTLPPLALAYKHRKLEAGETKTELKRLRLILVEAVELPGARSFVPALKRLVKDNYDQRHRVTLPHQYTDELLLWAYAMDGKQHAMFWLSPENQETDPFSPVLRHWQSAVPIRARVLPGMHFFDAWRIGPAMRIDPLENDDLDSFEGALLPREKWELRAQAGARTDAQLVREQTLQARAQNKTSAQMAAEIAQVHKLTTLLADRVEFLADLACSRHGYMDQVKTRTSAKADKKGLKRRAGDDPLDAPLRAASVPATSGAHTSPMEVDDVGRDAISASSSTARAPMDVESATAKGPSTTEGALPIPRDLANDILAAIPLLPNEWPLVKIDLILRNTDKYYMSWRRFLFVHELLRTFKEKAAVNVLRTNATSLVEHLVESSFLVNRLSPLWSRLEK